MKVDAARICGCPNWSNEVMGGRLCSKWYFANSGREHKFIFTLNLDRLIIFRLPKLIPCLDINDPQFDGVVVVTDTVQKLVDNKLDKVAAAVQEYAKVSSSTVLTSNLNTP